MTWRWKIKENAPSEKSEDERVRGEGSSCLREIRIPKKIQVTTTKKTERRGKIGTKKRGGRGKNDCGKRRDGRENRKGEK